MSPCLNPTVHRSPQFPTQTLVSGFRVLMVMIELGVPDKSRSLPPRSSFTIPFSSPSLKWGCRKRFRYSGSGAVLETRSDCHISSPSLDRQQSDGVDRSPAHNSEREEETLRREEEVGEEKVEGKLKLGGKGSAVEANKEGWFLRSKAAEAEGGRGRMENKRGMGKKKNKKVEFWISLSREEIEEDFYSFTGLKLSRRPKKRPRTCPPHLLERLFPGGWLPNFVTSEMYKVHQPPESRKNTNNGDQLEEV